MTGPVPAPAEPAARTDRLRSAGAAAWSLVGIALLSLALFLLMAVLRPMILALVIALFLAIAFSPLVDRLAGRGLPRPAAAAAGTLVVVVVAALVVAMVIAGVASQQEEINQSLDAAVTRLQGLLTSAGMSSTAAASAEASVRHSAGALLGGLVPALGNLFGAVVNVAIGTIVVLFTCFFLLNDGRAIAAGAGRLLPLPAARAKALLDQAATTIRRYFVGLTILGVFNACVVVVGALVLDVPLVGAIAVVTLLGSYVPYVGALVAGAFAVLIALGSGGTSTALWMALVALLANSLLQNLITPFAYGAALNVNPLLLLITALFAAGIAGVAGVALSAPVTAVVVHSLRQLRLQQPLPAAPVTEQHA